VASSIHQLAVILGEDLATKDLVPVFNGFIKDLDEVRIGALKHLAEFLKVIISTVFVSYVWLCSPEIESPHYDVTVSIDFFSIYSVLAAD
jgi:hypothetical protein